MPTTITVEGADELARSLGAAAGDLGDMADTNSQVASYLAAQAKAAAPRVTGALAASVVGTGEAGAAVITAGVVYAGVINYGWPRRNIAATEFLTGTARDSEPAITDRYAQQVRRVVDRIHGK